jgi:phosphoglycerate-specific signal transduction histidine kinase
MIKILFWCIFKWKIFWTATIITISNRYFSFFLNTQLKYIVYMVKWGTWAPQAILVIFFFFYHYTISHQDSFNITKTTVYINFFFSSFSSIECVSAHVDHLFKISHFLTMNFKKVTILTCDFHQTVLLFFLKKITDCC